MSTATAERLDPALREEFNAVKKRLESVEERLDGLTQEVATDDWRAALKRALKRVGRQWTRSFRPNAWPALKKLSGSLELRGPVTDA
jgi:hypothetical protein